MATGDQTDVQTRLESTLPPDWFPGTRPILDGLSAGAAAVLSWIYGLLQYVKLQTRVATATDGFLDVISLDFFGSGLPRLNGETDDAFRARIQANLFQKANTKAAIVDALEDLTGYPVRNIEPYRAQDNFCWGRSFWGVNNRFQPGQWSNGSARCAFLIQCAVPASKTFAGPHFGWNKGFWGAIAAGAGWWWNNAIAVESPEQLVYDLVKKLRAVGIRVFVQFVSPSELLAPTAEVLTDENGVALTDENGIRLTT